MATDLKGVITAIITPFKNGEIDLSSFKRLLRNQADQGVDGLVINGTTGESPNLNFEEVKQLYTTARAELGSKFALIVGTGSNSTGRTCEFTKAVESWKPDAALVVVPYYNKPPQRGLQRHFETVAECSSTPVLLYNVPGRTVAGLEAETVGKLSRHANIIGIKEATGDMALHLKMKSEASKDFIFLSGDDASCVDFAAQGGHGVISVSSHIIGKEMKDYLGKARDLSSGARYREHYKEFMRHLYIEANPIPVKAAAHWLGWIESPELRLPLVELDPKFHGDFKACLKKIGKL